MEIRHAIDPEGAKHLSTEELRRHFLIQDLFTPDASKMVYTYYDRLIVGGICPSGTLPPGKARDGGDQHRCQRSDLS
jgi:4-deoxy-L-threo-5-hexosulose-uronate ketol-isomerase